MRNSILSLCVFVIAAAPAAAQPAKPAPETPKKTGKVGTFPDESIEVKGKKREYRLVVPKSVDPDKPASLVFAFHGLLDSKDLMPRYSQLPRTAEKEGFILCFPNGLNRHWPIVPEWARDDLAFFDELCKKLETDYTIDPDRIYLTGMSNGAYFSNLVASQRADKIAAIAAHSGGIGFVKEDKERRKYPVMIIHGEYDSIVKVEEGHKARDAYKKWGHEVDYIEIPKLNHFWAGSQGINDQIWKFFKEHPRK
jgi:polyhydroxybutyrate depolymerase